jgi:hypothetical protein
VQLTSLSTFPGINYQRCISRKRNAFFTKFHYGTFIVTLKVGIITSDPINKVPETLRQLNDVKLLAKFTSKVIWLSLMVTTPVGKLPWIALRYCGCPPNIISIIILPAAQAIPLPVPTER